MKIKISKEQVNIGLTLLSLVGVGVFLTTSYMPKNKEIEAYENKYSQMIQYKDKGTKALNSFKGLEQDEDISSLEQDYMNYLDKLNEMLPSEINESYVFSEIERASKETNVDVYQLSRLEENSSTMENHLFVAKENDTNLLYHEQNCPDTTSVPQEELKVLNSIEEVKAQFPEYKPHDCIQEQQVPQMENASTKSYSVKIRGEYRSLMMFMYKVQNLSMLSEVKGFSLDYNSEIYKPCIDMDNSKAKSCNVEKELYEDHFSGFPLEAEFQITFHTRDNI